MAHQHTQRTHEQWLLDLTNIPTAAGREARVIAWITAWVARRRNLVLTRDRAGNLFITQRRREQAGAARAPIFITAHLDHPAFVVLSARDGEAELEFRGSVHDPYFENAPIEIFSQRATYSARIMSLNAKDIPFKRATEKLDDDQATPMAGDLARVDFAALTVPKHANAEEINEGGSIWCDHLDTVYFPIIRLSSINITSLLRRFTTRSCRGKRRCHSK